MSKNFKILGTIIVAWNTIYLAWLFYHVTNLGYILLFAEFLIASLTYILIFNHWGQSHTFHHFHQARGSVDIFITTVNEPVVMLDNTVKAASAIDYLNKTIYVLDDGPRDEIKMIVQKYGANYLARRGRIDGKAGNLNFGLQNSTGEYILVIDSDHVANPFIIKDLLGHFDDGPEVAVVATRQAYLVPEGDFNHDVLFYQHMMAGKHEDNASISCGNGVFYRRSALRAIGGFQVWNLVEDLYTSYVLHTRGFKTVYINQPYTYGTAPLDLANIYKQRGTWALDTLRMIFWHSPLFARGLKFWQRLHYIEIGYSYVVSAIAMPIVFILPAIAVLYNDPIVTDPITYLLLRIPSLLAILYFYYRLSDRMFSQMQYWASLFLVYMEAFFLALICIKVPYKVTRKEAADHRNIALVIPHIALILFSFGVILWRIFIVDHALTAFTAINLMWACLMVFWFAPVIYRGFQRVNADKMLFDARQFVSAKYPHLFNGRAPRTYNPPLDLPVENIAKVFE
ncbi:MAG: glycosyltransferase [Patescibacteria group bacterium]